MDSWNDLIVMLTLPDGELCFGFNSSLIISYFFVVCGGFQTHITQNATDFFLSYAASDRGNMIQCYNSNNKHFMLIKVWNIPVSSHFV